VTNEVSQDAVALSAVVRLWSRVENVISTPNLEEKQN